MALVKLEIDGQPVAADTSQSILEAARQHGIDTIPTLCHDPQLEPFASCYVCVVKVKGARSLLPACSTKVTDGMVVDTNGAEVRESRKAALELLLSDHYADCVGPCQIACPAEIDIQGYIALAALGKYKDAIALIKSHNPLPSVCGRVCTRPCEVKGCRRNMLDEAVGIDYIKRYISDLDLNGPDVYRPAVAPSNGRRVAVVGAGPAGLSAAYYLAIRGYEVEIFESEAEPGGMLRYGIPEYRLPKDVLDLEIAQVLALGPTLTTGKALGRDFTIASLQRDGFEAIFLGIGAWRSTAMHVENERAAGVLSGIEFLRRIGLREPVDLHGTVVVVGGGNTAIDCARTARRLGVDAVTLLYRRTRAEMPANDSEIRDAIEEGVALEFLVAPVKVLTNGEGRVTALECQRMELGAPDASGRRSPRPVAGSEFTVPCDVVLAAIGQGTIVPDLVGGQVADFLPEGQTLELTRWKTVQVDERTLETTVAGVFSGGDVVTGAATAIEAIAAGRKGAFAIDTYLREGRARPEPREFLSRKDTFAHVSISDLRSQVSTPKRTMPLIPVDQRVQGFAEVELGYSAHDVSEETARCLECGCVALFDCDLRRYATEYGVEVKKFLGEARQHQRDTSHPLIELDPNKCILCARCVRMCSDVVGVSVFGFINRGFSTVVAPALGESLLDAGCISCGLCVGTCPTGAIAQKLPLAKPGPWPTRTTSSICHYCGIGCRIDLETYGDMLVKVARNEDNEVTFGDHCRKAIFGFGYVHAKDRLTTGKIRRKEALADAAVGEALDEAAARLRDAASRYPGGEMAVLVSPRMTNEELYLAQRFARGVLKTHNVASFSQILNPDLLAPSVLATATYGELVQAQAIVVVNSDLEREHFVADLLAKRSIRKGGRLIYVGPEDNRTAECAEVFLQCAPGGELLVLQALVAAVLRLSGIEPASRPDLVGRMAGLAGDQFEAQAGVSMADVDRGAAVLAESERRVLVFNRDYRGARRRHDAGLLAAAATALGCAILPLHEKGNAQGLLDMGAHPSWYPGYRSVSDEAAIRDLEKEWGTSLRQIDTRSADLAHLLADGTIKAALIFGEDPLGLPDLPDGIRGALASLDLLVVADVFMTETARAADVVLPMSAPAETTGTFTNSERRVQQVRRAVMPAAGMETWQLIMGLAERMGCRALQYGSPADVLDEIRRAVPAYRHVAVDSQQADGIWDRARSPLPAPAPHGAASGEAVRVRSTSALDHLDARFDRWFAGLLGRDAVHSG